MTENNKKRDAAFMILSRKIADKKKVRNSELKAFAVKKMQSQPSNRKRG